MLAEPAVAQSIDLHMLISGRPDPVRRETVARCVERCYRALMPSWSRHNHRLDRDRGAPDQYLCILVGGGCSGSVHVCVDEEFEAAGPAIRRHDRLVVVPPGKG